MYEPEAAWKWQIKAQMLRARANAMEPSLEKTQFTELADHWERKAREAELAPWTKPAGSNPRRG